MKRITNSFVVVSDYGWLPENIEDSWVHKECESYLLLDKMHRFKESENVRHQKNVGQNVYDMFDFIVNNYDNLPNQTLFCRACLMFPRRLIIVGILTITLQNITVVSIIFCKTFTKILSCRRL